VSQHEVNIRLANLWAIRQGYSFRSLTAGGWGPNGRRFFYGPDADRKAAADEARRP
jgi:hypothetical protein